MLKRLMGIVSQLSVRELLEISKASENDPTINICIVRHGKVQGSVDAGETIALGGLNDERTYLSEIGEQEIIETAYKLKPELEGIDSSRLYGYTNGLQRCQKSYGVLFDTLGVTPCKFVMDSELNGRKYGDRIEGRPESEVYNPKTLLKEWDTTREYLKSQVGSGKNSIGIEPKKAYKEKVLGAMDEILVKHNPGDVVIMCVNSDIPKVLSKDTLCKKIFTRSHQEKLHTGEYVWYTLKPWACKMIQTLKLKNGIKQQDDVM